MNIGASSNDNYAPHLGAMLFSTLKNCSNPKRIKIFIADGGISQANKAKLKEMVRSLGSSISFFLPDKKSFKDLKVGEHFGIETYYRLFLIDSLRLDKLLYFDADIIVERDILELAGLKFGKNLAFAVQDPEVSKMRAEMIGIKEGSYFNAGVMYINCKQWRDDKITKRVIDFIRKNPDKVAFADQDGLNFALNSRWGKLDRSWNLVVKYLPWIKILNFRKEELERVIKKPVVIHYASITKPWFILDRHPLRERYWFYLRQTPWKGYSEPDRNPAALLKRILKFASFLLRKPAAIFRKYD
jgi:lipopolysaccharide biosynthesis glycosyltransferase